MAATLAERFALAPRLSAPAEARRRLAALIAASGGVELASALAHEGSRDLLAGLADHSPYLWGLASEDPGRLVRLLGRPPGDSLNSLIGALSATREGDEAELMRRLRLAKREAALLIALADVGGVWDLDATTEALTRFADAAVGAALAFLLRQNGRAGRLAIDPDAPDPQHGCGMAVLALGKHGARELNYSSDVDLIVLYDAASALIPAGTEPAPLFVRITKALARILQERTSEGYVLRVDLRLRPDPASTPVALSTLSAYAYYETVGQNWERAALIKARPAAGDLALGRRFLADLAPFIWRKYFDYAAIADIHAMKRQIHAVRGHDRVVVPGHDLKLGRGGIREVEFFVQTQQLIFGGRRPRMRGSRTLDMLRELSAEGWVDGEAVEELSEAYGFLRRIEHRLQMVADEQTQRLPYDRAPLARFARFCGYAQAGGLRQGAHLPSDAGRAPLRAAVRGRAGIERPGRQSGLHRRRRRSRNAGDAEEPRIPRSRTGRRDDPRLALRPARRRPQPTGERGADGTDARAPGGFRRFRRRGCGTRRIRRGADPHAGVGRATVDPALQREIA